MMPSRGVRAAPYLVAVAAPSNPSSLTGIRGTAREVGGPDRMDALRAVGFGHSPPCVQGVSTLAGAVSTTWRPMRTVSWSSSAAALTSRKASAMMPHAAPITPMPANIATVAGIRPPAVAG